MNCFECKNFDDDDGTCNITNNTNCPDFDPIEDEEVQAKNPAMSCSNIVGCGLIILVALICAPSTVIKIIELIVGLFK